MACPRSYSLEATEQAWNLGRLPLDFSLLTVFLQPSVCHVMVFFTRGFGGRDQIAIVQLRDQTISLALLGVTIINANSWRPRLNSKGNGSCTFNYGCPLHIAGLDVASMFIWNRAPFFKAASICLGGNRSFSTSDNFLLELWKAGFKWEDLVSRVSIHYVRNHCTSLWCLLCIS